MIGFNSRIVFFLQKMKCPHKIEPHQIQGMDCIHIFAGNSNHKLINNLLHKNIILFSNSLTSDPMVGQKVYRNASTNGSLH
jgi:hypothetical protein